MTALTADSAAALEALKRSMIEQPEAPEMMQVSGPSVQGTGIHHISATLLNTEAAAGPEGLDNVLDAAAKAAVNGESIVYHKYIEPKHGYLLEVSSTKVDPNSWLDTTSEIGIFDQNPQHDEGSKAHAHSMHNYGFKLAGEHLTGGRGDTFVLTQDVDDDGRVLHRVGRTGAACDSASGSLKSMRKQYVYSVEQGRVHGDNKKTLSKTLDLVAGTPLEMDSRQETADNFAALFDEPMKCALRHNKGNESWFCTAVGPLVEVACKEGEGETKEIMHVNEETGELMYVNHNHEVHSVAALLQKQYLPISTGLIASPLQHVQIYIQGKELDLKKSEWDLCEKYGSLETARDVLCIFPEPDRVQSFGQDGVVAKIESRQIPSDGSVSRGVCVAFGTSTRLLSTDPLAFEKHELSDARMSHTTVAELYNRLDDLGRNARNSWSKKKIPINYADLVQLMDKQPCFGKDQWDAYLSRVRNMQVSGFESLRRAVGMMLRTNVLITVDMPLNYAKNLLITRPAELPPKSPEVNPLLGAIFRTIVEGCFAVEQVWATSSAPMRARPVTGKRTARAEAEDNDDDDDDDASDGTRDYTDRPARSRQRTQRYDAGPADSSDSAGTPAKKTSSEKKRAAAAAKRLKNRFKKDIDDAIARNDFTKITKIEWFRSLSADIALL